MIDQIDPSSSYEEFSKAIRKKVLRICHEKQTAHLGSALSVIDILSVISKLCIPKKIDYRSIDIHDDVILSKGHAALALYSTLQVLGFITESELNSYSDAGSVFEEHPNQKIPTVHFPTGSLGHGLPLGCGLALGARLKNLKKKTVVIMSDGECNEGTVWEATQFARSKELGGLFVFVDHNKFQATGSTTETLSTISISEAFAGFDWNVREIDGHDHQQIHDSLNAAPGNIRPTAVICHTVKGKGVSFMESDNNWHYKAPNVEELELAIRELN